MFAWNQHGEVMSLNPASFVASQLQIKRSPV